VYRAIMLASQANAPVYITKVMSRTSADVVADSRRTGDVRVLHTCQSSSQLKL